MSDQCNNSSRPSVSKGRNGRRKTRQKADRALARWLRGEVDKVELVTTPDGKRFVDQYNRDPNAGG
jgi:hypothetical protein